MSLSTNVYDLAIRVASEAKSLRTLINGNAADLSGLDTTAKANLVVAINEIAAAVASASGIDDAQTSTSTSWSSTKTSNEIATASTADRDRANHTGTQSADTLTDGTTNKAYTADEQTKLAGVATGATANSTDAQLRDRATHTGTQAAATISDFEAAVDARIELRVDGAPSALDTLNELAAAIGDDPNFAGTVATGLANRVRVDAAQTLTAEQMTQARTNIGAVAAVDVGPTDTNYVTVFEAALA